SRRKGCRDRRGNVPYSVLACSAGRDRRFYPGGAVFAFRFSGFRIGGCDDAFADLPVVGAASLAAVDRYIWGVCSGDARRLQTRREHSTTRRRARASIFVRQEQGRRVTRI